MGGFIEIGDGGNGGNVGDGIILLRHDVGARRAGIGHHLAYRCDRPYARLPALKEVRTVGSLYCNVPTYSMTYSTCY